MLPSACMVGPEYRKPTTSLPAAYRYEDRKNGKAAAARSEWWKLFGDERLNGIIADVRANNHDLRAGLQRVEQSRALVRLAGAGSFPLISTTPSATRNRTSAEVMGGTAALGGATFSSYTVPLETTWELDLFGRIRRGQQAAAADAEAAEEDLNALRLALESEAAGGFFNLRALDREIGLVEAGISSRKESVSLAKDRLDRGVVSSLDVSQASALLATSEADLEGLLRLRSAQEAALAVLAGQPASGFRIPRSPLSSTPPSVPAGLPAELLRSRPDIRKSERALAAENARVGVAEAAFYPSVSLNGAVGVQATDLASLFSGAGFWGIGPEVYVPLFQGGANQAELDRSRARYEEVLQNYQQTILEALNEVETLLAAQRQLKRQVAAQTRAVAAAHEARDTANAQYQGGATNYLAVLDAERTSLDAERQQAVLSGVEFINTVNLIRALGGRW